MGNIEFQLRLGQLHDTLGKLCSALGLKSFLVRRKYQVASGQGALLRSETEIHRAGCQVKKWKEVYSRGWRALNELKADQIDFPDTHPSKQLQELKDSDCVMLSEWLDEHRFWHDQGEMAESAAAEKGKGKRELPWFWRMQFERPEGEEDDGVGEAVQSWANDGESVLP